MQTQHKGEIQYNITDHPLNTIIINKNVRGQCVSEPAKCVHHHFFQPLFLIIVIWLQLTFTFQTNTFQGAIITDTVFTYYVFSFTCGEIEWSGQGFETAIVGYNSNGDYFVNHPANGFSDIGDIISCTIHTLPGGRRKKRQMAADGAIPAGAVPADQVAQGDKQVCIGIAKFDDQDIMEFNDLRNANNQIWTAALPGCPPIEALIQLSGEFQPFPLQGDNCYRSNNMFVPMIEGAMRTFQFVSVCCYDENNG